LPAGRNVKNKTVVVLESRAGAQLAESLTRRGATAVWTPALAELPDLDTEMIRRLVEDWAALSPVLAIFQTGVGTRALFQATDALGLTDRLLRQLDGISVAIRGPKPAAELARRQVRVDLRAASPFTTQELLQAIGDVPCAGRTVLVQRYGDSNRELLGALRARGASPREIATYRWALPANLDRLVSTIDAIISGTVDAVVFTSAVQARNLLTVATQQARLEALRLALQATLVASMGPVCTAALCELGIPPQLEASPPKLGHLVAALDQALSSEARVPAAPGRGDCKS
jgi:uroporphyrinogen-III synthase